ncbi:MAG: hypothetical protein DRP55_02515 [Spirochaetes bacterium]|nr:MAG: hypothetical protein DRP55_02515 [Spirochaetota bacterium]
MKERKALLIHAVDKSLIISEQPPFPFPVLGITTLAALFPENWEIEVIDEDVDLVDLNSEPDLIGISSLTLNIPHAYDIADHFRKKGIPVIMGGLHVSSLPHEALYHCDSVVIGEVEPVFDEILKDFENKKLKKIYKAKNFFDLKNVPIARRDLLKPIHHKHLTSVQATRGCPNNCEFCSVTPFFGHRYRFRPVEAVIKEIEMLLDMGMSRTIFFVDDNIAENEHYAEKLFKALIPLKIRWGSFASVRLAKNFKLLDLAVKSGCLELFIGFESLEQSNLEIASKNFVKVKEFPEIIDRFRSNGIMVQSAFIFGHDNDTKDIFKKTVDFVQRTGIDTPTFGILTPYPGTALRDRLIKEGRLIDTKGEWHKYDGSYALFQPKNMSVEELQQGYFWAKKYCCAPRSIIFRLLRRPNKNFFLAMLVNFSMRANKMKQIKQRWKKRPLVAPS